MWGFIRDVVDTSDFPARWSCGRWTVEHGWLHIASDLAIWTAYLAIPCVLLYFAWRKPDWTLRRVFWLFGAFILLCGTTHLMEAVIFWWPAYRLAGLIKLATALVSWATVLALIPLTPQALSLRTLDELNREIEERKRAEQELRRMHVELEQRVADRTSELTRANEALTSEIEVREQFEQALDRSREWFETTLASIGDAVIVTDTEGRVTFINAVARRLIGREDDLRGQPLDAVCRIVHETTSEPIENPAHVVLRTGQTVGLANHAALIAADGSRRPIADSAAPIRSAAGEILGVVLVFRDVTEQRRSAQALAEADRRKDQFLAILGHELRNPLSGIAGAIQVLTLTGGQTAEADEMRSIIQRQSAHMTRMVEDLLDVTRISRGKIRIRPEAVDLRQLVQESARSLQANLQQSDLKLTVELPSEPIPVSGDPTRLTQALLNLLQNAVKFSNAGGEITISGMVAPDGACARVTVRDQGIGMSEQTLAHVFTPFSQADSSLDRSQGGLGLGLALVKGLIELHGGRVRAESAGLGHGSVFTIELPLDHAAATLPVPQKPGPAGRNLRILMIDDQRDASVPISRLLEMDGHEVRLATDGPAGLAAARQMRPHVVLCDIGLPGGLSGYDVATALRREPWSRDCLLVAVTGYGSAADQERARTAGFDRHLTKPVGLSDLRELLRGGHAGPVGS